MKATRKNPINIIEKDKQLIFTKNLNKYSGSQSISFYRNTFLTRSGIGLKRFKILMDTIPHYEGKFKHFRKYALLHYFLRPKKRIKGDFIVIHNHWCPGYYHWVTEALPRLMRVRNFLDTHQIIIPESFKGYPVDSLKAFNLKIFYVKQKNNLIVENLLVPENTRYTAEYDVESVLKVREYYHNYLIQNALDTLDLGEKIYVSRNKAKNRKVTNEEEVTDYLISIGFKIIHFEDYNFWQQVSIMYHSKILLSIHGAGLTNQIFMKKESFVFELQKIVKKEENFSNSYLKLADILNNKYLYQFCRPQNEADSIYDANLYVDLELLHSNLNLISI